MKVNKIFIQPLSGLVSGKNIPNVNETKALKKGVPNVNDGTNTGQFVFARLDEKTRNKLRKQNRKQFFSPHYNKLVNFFKNNSKV